MENKQLKCLCALALTVGVSSKLNNNIALANPNNVNQVTSPNSICGVVTADALNVRSDANTSSRVIGTLRKNDKVTILETRNGWHRVKISVGEGWIYGEFVKVETAVVPSNKIGEITADSLNVRQGAGSGNKIIGSLKQGEKVELIDSINGWYKINYKGGYAYISSDFVKLSSSQDDSSRPSRGDDIDTTPAAKEGIINVTALNFRTGPGTNYGIISTLQQGNKVQIQSESNGWYKINFNNTTGYISKEFVTLSTQGGTTNPQPPSPPPIDTTLPIIQGKVAIVNTEALNVRAGAGANFDKVAIVRLGDKLPILTHSNGWYKVTIGNTVGWVSGDYIKITNESDASTPIVRETPLIDINYSGLDVVRKAEQYLGVPYVWGGFTPIGFDCSGLVQYVYRQLGVELERTTYYQVHQGITVTRDNLQPGDLIFFNTDDDNPSSVSHVGIYKGNDLFIQAPKAGDVVRVSNLNSAYYSNRYYIAKRIIK